MRANGILMPVFSLPSKYGVGDFGPEAFRFVDFLDKAGQSYWQILPLNPTNYGDSPYQSFSTFAGNPYFISPELLIRDGLLEKEEADAFDFGSDPLSVDYGKLYNNRILMLEKAFSRFVKDDAYKAFLEKNEWLDNYALFMVLKNMHEDKSWSTWEDEYRFRKEPALKKVKEAYAERLELYKFIQFKFNEQWQALKTYANERDIRIIGDVPIYVAYDSADVWASPEEFYLDKNLDPIDVSGCPPDAFSATGQLWGNPLYRYDKMAQGEKPFAWWCRRVGKAFELYDLVRIDHFRGFEAYYTIPFGSEDAIKGEWVKGPGMKIFHALKKEFGEDLPIIAEDLGLMTPGVIALLKESGFPGMKVLQFAFDSREESDYLPHNYNTNSIVYTGTHDNDTIMGWCETASPSDVAYAKKYLHANQDEGFNWTMMRAAMQSASDTCILMMQDLMGLGKEARINIPSTLGGNWLWRIDESCINDWLASIVRDYTECYWRITDSRKAMEKARKEAEQKLLKEKEEKEKAAAAALKKAETAEDDVIKTEEDTVKVTE